VYPVISATENSLSDNTKKCECSVGGRPECDYCILGRIRTRTKSNMSELHLLIPEPVICCCSTDVKPKLGERDQDVLCELIRILHCSFVDV